MSVGLLTLAVDDIFVGTGGFAVDFLQDGNSGEILLDLGFGGITKKGGWCIEVEKAA